MHAIGPFHPCRCLTTPFPLKFLASSMNFILLLPRNFLRVGGGCCRLGGWVGGWVRGGQGPKRHPPVLCPCLGWTRYTGGAPGLTRLWPAGLLYPLFYVQWGMVTGTKPSRVGCYRCLQANSAKLLGAGCLKCRPQDCVRVYGGSGACVPVWFRTSPCVRACLWAVVHAVGATSALAVLNVLMRIVQRDLAIAVLCSLSVCLPACLLFCPCFCLPACLTGGLVVCMCVCVCVPMCVSWL